MILFSHSSLLIFPDRDDGIFYLIKFLGTIGVDLFFVLSGFLIGNLIIKQIEKGKTAFKDFSYFWVRRWFKTLPNYFLILVLNILLILLFQDGIVKEITSYFFFLQNFSEEMPDFFTESWSLSIEEFSYIAGPLLLFLLFYVKSASKKILFLIITIFMILLGLGLRAYYDYNTGNSSFEDWSHDLRKVVIYRIDSIYYGFLGAFFYSYYSGFWKSNKFVFLIFGIFSFLALHLPIILFQFNPYDNPSFFNQLYLPWLLISMALFFPYFSSLKNNQTRVGSIVTYISVISYALYLVNYSLILLTMQKLLDIPHYTVWEKVSVLLSFWLLTFVSAHLLYRYFERPIMDLRDRRMITSKF